MRAELDYEVWFAIDNRTSECGFVAAASLLKHRPPDSHTKIRIAYEKTKPRPCDWWEQSLKITKRSFELQQIEIDLCEFSVCKMLFDSRSTFLRLLIPNFSKSEYCIYSDADVVFQENIENFFSINSKLSCLSLVKIGECLGQSTNERNLLKTVGKNDSSPYYIAGLALIHNVSYKTNQISLKAVEFAQKNAAFIDAMIKPYGIVWFRTSQS
jgi:lipopolysaccharide biosynthesis glycosyltransferase